MATTEARGNSNDAVPQSDGAIPDNRDLRGFLTARKGEIERRPRGGQSIVFAFTLGERFAVLRGRIIALLGQPPFSSLILNDERVYFRASKGAAQNQFVVMTEENFATLLVQRVKRVSRKEKEAWNHDVIGNLQFEFYVYCRERLRAMPTIHRATASRIIDATRAVQRFQEKKKEQGVNLSPIAMNHVVTTHARQPDDTVFSMPDDNTTRQALALDEAGARLEELTRVDVSGASSQHIATIRLEVNHTWNNFRVDVASLRRALGLPEHDIFRRGIFHGFVPVDPPEDDMEDVDHMQDDVQQNNDN